MSKQSSSEARDHLVAYLESAVEAGLVASRNWRRLSSKSLETKYQSALAQFGEPDSWKEGRKKERAEVTPTMIKIVEGDLPIPEKISKLLALDLKTMQIAEMLNVDPTRVVWQRQVENPESVIGDLKIPKRVQKIIDDETLTKKGKVVELLNLAGAFGSDPELEMTHKQIAILTGTHYSYVSSIRKLVNANPSAWFENA